MKLYKIAKWEEVYERAESRKLKQLTWVSMPIGLNSSGYQSLLDEFGDRAPAMYGAWCALVAVAANCHRRGILGNSRGNPLTISHLSRQTGFDGELFRDLFAWASTREVGWLECDEIGSTVEPHGKNIENTNENSVSGESPDDLPACQGNPPTTRHNKTIHNHIDTHRLLEQKSDALKAAWQRRVEAYRRQHGVFDECTEEAQLIRLLNAFETDEDCIEAINLTISASAKNVIINGIRPARPARPHQRAGPIPAKTSTESFSETLARMTAE